MKTFSNLSDKQGWQIFMQGCQIGLFLTCLTPLTGLPDFYARSEGVWYIRGDALLNNNILETFYSLIIKKRIEYIVIV